MDVDEALTALGRYSRWQMFTYTLVCLSVTVSGCWHMMVIVFTGGEPGHHCKLSEGEILNESIPLKLNLRGKYEYDKCNRYDNSSHDNKTMPCDQGWTYDDQFVSTIVSEWNLVCDSNYLVEVSQSVFVAGVMVGALVFTALADRIGRKPVHLGCQWAMIAVGLAIAFAPDYTTFTVLRFLLGAIREGAGLTGIVMACEIFPASQRTFAGTALELFWAAAWMILAVLAYFIRNWRHLQLTVTIPPVLTLALIWLLPESIPWLASNGKTEEAEAILRRAAAINHVTLPEPILARASPKRQKVDVAEAKYGDCEEKVALNSIEKDNEECGNTENNGTTKPPQDGMILSSNGPVEEPGKPVPLRRESLKERLHNLMSGFRKSKKNPEDVTEEKMDKENEYSCLDIVRSRKMFLYCFVMCSLWFASGIVYYGLSLSTSSLAGDKYLNFFLSGAVEAPAYLLSVFVLQRFGRRWPLCIFHLIAGIVLFANIFIPEETESGINLIPLIITLTMVGKFCMTAAFATVILYAPELYPTNLRNLGLGIASVTGRLAGTLAPFTSYIGKLVPWIPGVVFTAFSISTGFMTLLLPETLNRPLPETIEDIENWTRTLPEEYKHKNQGSRLKVEIRDDKGGGGDKSETAL